MKLQTLFIKTLVTHCNTKGKTLLPYFPSINVTQVDRLYGKGLKPLKIFVIFLVHALKGVAIIASTFRSGIRNHSKTARALAHSN
jgi:hypothetical protein